jgi:hypothetical protein
MYASHHYEEDSTSALIRPLRDQWGPRAYAFWPEAAPRQLDARRRVGSRMPSFSSALVPNARTTSRAPRFGCARHREASGREPSSATAPVSPACPASTASHPHGAAVEPSGHERPKTVAAGLSADDIRQLLAVIPDMPTGLRDRAIIVTLTFTGRRRAEVIT